MLKRLVFSSVISGIVVGLLITALQSFTVIPMILNAETFESSPSAPVEAQGNAYSNDHGSHDHGGSHHHGVDEWTPEDGVERTFYTAITNILAAIGFALLLATCFMFRNNIDWRKGILWGLGGFVAFQLAPSLGLPPELPGTEAAAIEARQIWWIATAIATAIGLLLLALGQGILLKVSGLLLIVIPQLVGAPQSLEHSALAPESLITQFIITTTIIGAVFWILLGAATAYTHNKFSNF